MSGPEAWEEAETCSSTSYCEPDGEPYDVLASLTSSGDVPGFSPLQLPQTIEAAAIASILLTPDGISLHDLVTYAVPLMGSALGVTIAQGYITWFITADIIPEESSCEEGDATLRTICLGVFMTVMVNNLKDLFDVYRWLSRMPRSSHHELLRMQRFKSRIINDSDKGFVGDEIGVNKVVSGITSFELLLSYALLMLKASLLVVLTWYGAGYIARSPTNESLIMNSVALGFVVDLSSYFYRCVTNTDMRYFLEAVPLVGLSAQEVGKTSALLEEYWPSLSVLILGCMTALVWHHWSRVVFGAPPNEGWGLTPALGSERRLAPCS